MATINPSQDYDIIHTLTFTSASGTCPIRLFRGSGSNFPGTVYYRAGTSGSWTSLTVSNIGITFPVSNTTMQVAHDWNKSGDNYMTPSFVGSTNLLGIAISQKAPLSGVLGSYFMHIYASGCTSLTSLAVPDTSNLTSVGDNFMQGYAQNCSSLTSLSAPDTSNVTSVGHNFMPYYAQNCTSLTSLSVPDTSNLTSVGSFFMYQHAQNCTSLTSLSVPDTSNLTSVGGLFMGSYADGCTSLTRLELPKVGWFEANNVNWSVPAARLGILKGYVTNETDFADWQALTVSGKTLHTNYIRSTSDVVPIYLSRFDAISISENIRANVTALVTVSDAISTSEVITRRVTRRISALDTTSITELIQRSVTHSAQVLETVTVSESQTREVTHRSSAETTILTSEAISVNSDGSQQITETLTLAESVNSTADYQRGVFENTSISEITSSSLVFLVQVADNITLQEDAIAASGIFAIAIEGITITGSVEREIQTTLGLLDQITLAEEVSPNLERFASLVDIISYTDDASAQMVLVGELFDALAISEHVTLRTNISQEIHETVAINEFLVSRTEGNFFLQIFSEVSLESSVQTTRESAAEVHDVLLLQDSAPEAALVLTAFAADTLLIEEATSQSTLSTSLVFSTIGIVESLNVTRSFTVNIEIQDTVSIESPIDRLVETWSSIVEEIVLEDSAAAILFFTPGILFDTLVIDEEVDNERYSFNQDWWSGRGRINPQNKWSGTATTI